jgi:hypothetical protein
MKKFNNFIDFSNHVKVLKTEKMKRSVASLNTGVFIDDLSNFTIEQIEHILPPDKYDHLEYLFANRGSIKYKECLITKSVSWLSYDDRFSIVFEITHPTGEVIELKSSNFINGNGLPVDLEFEIKDIYLKKDFMESNVINSYSNKDIKIIELYQKLFPHMDKVNYNTKHVMNKKTKIIVADDIQFIIFYEFLARTVIMAGISKKLFKISDTFNTTFSEKVKSFLENDYIKPILGKTIEELDDNDITVFQMHEI